MPDPAGHEPFRPAPDAAELHRTVLEVTGPWLRFVTETGGNPIPELLADHTAVQINAPRALVAVAVKAQVYLLARLQANGLLRQPGAD